MSTEAKFSELIQVDSIAKAQAAALEVGDIPEDIKELTLILAQLGPQLESLASQVEPVTVGAVSDLCAPLPSVGVVHVMARLKALNEAADEAKKAIGKAYNHVRMSCLPEKMGEEGLDGLRVEGVGRVSITADIHARTLDKEGAFIWLEENGHGDIVQETVNAGTLKALLRRRLREGEEIPETLFKVSPFERASITKA